FYSIFFSMTAVSTFCTLSLHDALPIFLLRIDAHRLRLCSGQCHLKLAGCGVDVVEDPHAAPGVPGDAGAVGAGVADVALILGLRSEEHTSELQSRFDLVCRLLLEKKKQ